MKLFKPLNKPLKLYRNKFRNWKLMLKTRNISFQIKDVLTKQTNTIPVIIVSYNNGIYVDNMTKQLNNFNITPIIVDNNSSEKITHDILNNLEHRKLARIVRSKYNYGHMVGFLKPIYDLLPEVFAYTDPDLQLNKNLPNEFLTILKNLTHEIPVFKVGFALALNIDEKFKETTFHSCHYKPIYFEKDLSIKEFESRYWICRLQHKDLELYAAPIDTTFAVYRKSNYIGDFHSAIRVAGKFSAIHLPWFTTLDLMNKQELDQYKKHNRSSNWL